MASSLSAWARYGYVVMVSGPLPVEVVHQPATPWLHDLLFMGLVPFLTTLVAASVAFFVAKFTVNRNAEIQREAAAASYKQERADRAAERRVEREERLQDERVKRSHEAASQLRSAFGSILPKVGNLQPGVVLPIDDFLWTVAVSNPDLVDLEVMNRVTMVRDFFIQHADWVRQLPELQAQTPKQLEGNYNENRERLDEMARWVKWILLTLAVHRAGFGLPPYPEPGRHYHPTNSPDDSHTPPAP